MKQANARLPDDVYEEVMEYAEENDISKSEALRRSIRTGVHIEKEGLTRKRKATENEEKEPVADGGEVMRRMFAFLDALYAFLGLGSLAGFLVLGYMGHPWSLRILAFSLCNFMLLGVLSIVLWSSIPEKIDRWGYSKSRRIMDVLSGGSYE
jgi:hypothetical protein